MRFFNRLFFVMYELIFITNAYTQMENKEEDKSYSLHRPTGKYNAQRREDEKKILSCFMSQEALHRLPLSL